MNNIRKNSKRSISLIMAIIMLVGLLSGIGPVAYAAEEIIASWNYTSAAGMAAQSPADGGANAAGATLQFGNGTITPSYSSTAFSVTDWTGADASWLIEVSTTGYTDPSITFSTRSSATGPRDFKVQVSNDGLDFADVPDGEYAVTSTSLVKRSFGNGTTTLPLATPGKEVDNQNTLYIRMVLASTILSGAGTGSYSATDQIRSGGTSQINNIVITSADESTEPPIQTLNPPTASPPTGTYAELPTVALSAEAGATIYYTTDGSEPAASSTVYSSPINTSALTSPVTVKAFAAKSGATSSSVATFVYTLADDNVVLTPDGTSGSIASWDYSVVPGTNPAPATAGDFKDDSKLGAYTNTTIKTLTFSSSGMAASDFATSPSYWLIETSTKGFMNLELSFAMRASNAGPRDFKVQYSTDNSTWTDAGSFSLAGGALVLADTRSQFNIDLSAYEAGTADKDTLYLRLLVNSTVSANGGTLANGGTNTINYINLTGDYVLYENQVKAPTADKSSIVKLNETVSFASETEGSTTRVSYDGSDFSATSPITLDALPKTVYVKAVKEGMTDSRIIKIDFTQKKLDSVVSSPGSGQVESGTGVSLTAESGAEIRYIMTTKAGETEEQVKAEALYSDLITLTDDMFPVEIKTWAIMDGCINSDETTFTFTPRPSAGGEQNYFGQLHAHTTLSDGAGDVEEAYEYARDTAGLDFFAVTDHSNSYDKAPAGDKAGTYNLTTYNADNASWVRGKAAAANAKTATFASTFGFEMTWSGGPGHINTFNTGGVVSRLNTELNNKSSDAGLRAYYNLLKASPDSISQFNHPGTTFGNFTNFAYLDPVIDSRITMIEVGNGEGTLGSGGYFPSYEQYTLALDKGWHVAPTNNQDNHKKGWGTSNTCRTVIWTNDLSEAGLFQAMKDMRIYATEVSDLEIEYRLNGQPLGSILDAVPAAANITASIKNPTSGNTVKSVSVVTNGGVQIGTEQFGTQNADYAYTINTPAAGYYYLRVVCLVGGQERIAVTAPVWLGKAEAVGITEITKSTDLPVTMKPLTISTGFFNNEDVDATLTSITYKDGSGTTLGSDTPNSTITKNGGSFTHSFTYTPTVAENAKIEVTATIMVNGSSKTYTKDISFKVTDIDSVVYIGVDGSHYNEYVNGNYKDSMTNFATLASEYGVSVITYTTSEDLIAACSDPKVKMLIITAPSRRVPAPHKSYSQAELDAIASFAQSGRPIIVAGWSDLYENYNYVESGLVNHMAGQQNALLAAIGSNLRIGDDATADEVLNPSPNQYRLYFENTFNAENPLAKNVVAEQIYSIYGGSTVYAVDSSGNPTATMPSNASEIVRTLPTTWSQDRDNDGYGLPDPSEKLPRYGSSADAGRGTGTVAILVSETVDHGNGNTSLVIASGSTFMSNFEIQIEKDNIGTLPYSNYTIMQNILETIAPQEEAVITSIDDAKKLPAGTEVTIEGIATSSVNTQNISEATNKGFFDCIYAQDATGGINLFPISDGVTEGQKIRVTGTLSSYQGEVQLQVTKYTVIDPAINRVAPTEVSTANAMIPANTGKLVKLTGVVSGVISEADGTVNQFTINDSSGPALIYINSYITKGVDLSFVTNGATVTVTGLASIGENHASSNMLPRIRVRDRGEIVLTASQAIDKTILASYLAVYSTLNPNDYTTSSWTAYNNAHLAGKAVYDSPSATQQEIDDAVSALSNAIAGLVASDLQGKIDVLKALTDALKTLNSADYTPSSWSVLDTALTEADAVLAKGTNATIEEVQAAIDKLNAAVSQLSAKHKATPTGVPEYTKITTPGKTLADTNLKIGTILPAGGTISWDMPLTTVVTANTAYSWTYTPADTANYNVLRGTITPYITSGTTESNRINPATATFDKTEGEANHKDISITLTAVGATLSSIKNGNTVLRAGVDYTVNGNVYTIKTSYLMTLATGTYKLVFDMNTGEDPTLTITITQTQKPQWINPFTDVKEDDWFYGDVEYVHRTGLYKGTTDTTFSPNEPMTRGMIVTVLGRLEGIDADNYSGASFSDVDTAQYYAPYIKWAEANGIVNGIGNNKFNPDGYISRQDLATILLRYTQFKKVTLPNLVPKINFKDAGDIADYAANAVDIIQRAGIINGKPGEIFDPLGNATRAEVAAMLHRYAEVIK